MISIFSISKRRAIALGLVTLAAAAASLAQPAWVKKRPVLPGIYVGIGISEKNRPAAEYTETAKNNALNDIASQIAVSISSDVLRKVMETNAALQEEFQSNVRASAKADLDGVQIADTYEDGNSYWVFCRISKAEYEERRASKMRTASSLSLDLFTAGKKQEQEGNPVRAIGSYVQAFGPIEKFLAEPIEVTVGGTKVFLVNEIYRSLQDILGRIELRVDDPKREATISRPLKKPFLLSAIVTGKVESPAPGLPLRCSFLRGSGLMADRITTDRDGRARCDIQKITASDRIQLVEVLVDLPGLVGEENASPLVQTLLRSFPPIKTRLTLNVSGVEVFVESKESMFDNRLTQKRIEPVVKSRLGERGFSFIDNVSKAALHITIQAEARQGTSNYGLCFAFVTVNVTVLDLETGQEIFNGKMEDVKEGSDTYEKAALKGLDAAAKKIVNDLVPKVVEAVQR